MPKFTIVAYAEPESRLPRREAEITAPNREIAEEIAWEEFYEYHEIGVYEGED